MEFENILKGRIEMIYVTRHGQTDWNVQKKVMGRCDEPLNETGLKQAEETRNNLLNTKILKLLIFISAKYLLSITKSKTNCRSNKYK